MANKKIYVSMTDKFMSGWGKAQNKINKLVLECDTLQEAQIVFNNAESRSDMRYINICVNKPRYNKNRYYTSLKTKADYPAWYVANSF